MASITKTERMRVLRDSEGKIVTDDNNRQVRIATGGYFWLLTYRENNHTRREVKRRFSTKAEAERFRDRVIVEQANNTYVSPGRGKMTLREFTETTWLNAQTHRKSTEEQVARHLKNHILPALGNKRLQDITPADCAAFVTQLTRKLEPSTVRVIFTYTASILNSAVEHNVIGKSPLRGIKRPALPNKTMYIPSAEKVFAIADLMPPRLQALVRLAATSGLRQSELYGLTWSRVDLEAMQLHVDRQLVRIDVTDHVNGKSPRSYTPVFGLPKTEKSVRTVPLGELTVKDLKRHRREFPPGEHGLVFTNALNRPMRRSTFEGPWKAAIKARNAHELAAASEAAVPDEVDDVLADVSARHNREHHNFHALRHFYASMLIQNGHSVKVIQELLGHKSATETLDTYGHLWELSDDEVRATVDKTFASMQPPPATPAQAP